MKINNVTELQTAIMHLEVKNKTQEKILKDQFHEKLESLKPVNLLKSTFKEVVLDPTVQDHYINNLMVMVKDTIAKKVVLGHPGTLLNKVTNKALEVAVGNIFPKYAYKVKAYGQAIIKNLT